MKLLTEIVLLIWRKKQVLDLMVVHGRKNLIFLKRLNKILVAHLGSAADLQSKVASDVRGHGGKKPLSGSMLFASPLFATLLFTSLLVNGSCKKTDGIGGS